MGDPVRAQYEAYPYPARDPQDERRRLVTGSPSHLLEIEHYLFAGRIDRGRHASTTPLAIAIQQRCGVDGIIIIFIIIVGSYYYYYVLLRLHSAIPTRRSLCQH